MTKVFLVGINDYPSPLDSLVSADIKKMGYAQVHSSKGQPRISPGRYVRDGPCANEEVKH